MAEAKQDTETLGRAKDQKQQLLSEIEELMRQVKEKKNFVASTNATIASASANIRAIEKRFEGTITLLNNREEALVGWTGLFSRLIHRVCNLATYHFNMPRYSMMLEWRCRCL